MDLAAVVFAGQAMGELVEQGRRHQCHPGQGDDLPPQQGGEMGNDLLPVSPHHHGRGHDAPGRGDQEGARPDKPQLGLEPVEQLIGVEEGHAPEEQALPAPARRGGILIVLVLEPGRAGGAGPVRRGPSLGPLEESLLPGHLQEVAQILVRQRLAEFGLEGGADGLVGPRPVELFQQEGLLLPEVVISARAGVLDDALPVGTRRAHHQFGPARRGVVGPSPGPLEESLLPGHLQEVAQILVRQRLAEFGLEGGADGLVGPRPVELFQQEGLLLPEVVIPARAGVLDDALPVGTRRAHHQFGPARRWVGGEGHHEARPRTLATERVSRGA